MQKLHAYTNSSTERQGNFAVNPNQNYSFILMNKFYANIFRNRILHIQTISG